MIAVAVAAWALVLAALAFVYYVRYVEPAQIEVTRRVVRFPELPAGLEGLTIAHLSDFHCQPDPAIERSSREAVRLAMAAEPDLIAITGDLFETGEMAARCPHQIAGLRAPLGVYAVLGNHDRGHEDAFSGREASDEDVAKLRVVLAELGMVLLVNESRSVEAQGARLVIAGVDEYACGRDDAAAALAGAAGADLIILLAHTPDIVDDPQARRADLILCGHTHGGQIRLPGIGSPWAPVWRDRRRSAGLLRVGAALCYVSRGIASATRARCNCRPEVALLTLARGEEDGATPVPVLGAEVRETVEEVVP